MNSKSLDGLCSVVDVTLDVTLAREGGRGMLLVGGTSLLSNCSMASLRWSGGENGDSESNSHVELCAHMCVKTKAQYNYVQLASMHTFTLAY